MIVESIPNLIVSRACVESILACARVRGIYVETIHILGSFEPSGNNSFCVETIRKSGLDLIVSRVVGVLKLGDHLRGRKEVVA